MKTNTTDLNRIFQKLDEIEKKINQSQEKKLDDLESRVDGVTKFRWITIGIATAASVVIGSSGFFANLLTHGNTSGTVGGANTNRSK